MIAKDESTLLRAQRRSLHDVPQTVPEDAIDGLAEVERQYISLGSDGR